MPKCAKPHKPTVLNAAATPLNRREKGDVGAGYSRWPWPAIQPCEEEVMFRPVWPAWAGVGVVAVGSGVMTHSAALAALAALTVAEIRARRMAADLARPAR